MLVVDQLTIKYENGFTPVKDLSLVLKSGETGCILGLSGIGKSTLLKALVGILTPSEGEVSLDKQPLKPSTHLIGYVPQDYGLYPWKTVYDNIIILNHIKNKPYTRKYFNQIIETLHIKGLLKKYPHMLSGGEKQRVALARVFLFAPDIMLLDEPFSSLDEMTRNTAQNLFLTLWKTYQPTTLIVTHSVDEALKLGHYIFIQNKNSIETLMNPSFDVLNQEKMNKLKFDIKEKLSGNELKGIKNEKDWI